MSVAANGISDLDRRLEDPMANPMKLIITVEDIQGNCPVYKSGDRIVLDDGYILNIKETSTACMHSLASIIPYHLALSHGVPPEPMGLARKDKKDGKAYVQCLDPCRFTGGGTVTFSIEAVKAHPDAS